MKITVNIDENQLKKARKLTGINDVSEVLNEGLRSLIGRESARRLAALGGSDPNLRDIPRRRFRPQTEND